jgi:hypothetical protein
MSTFNVGDRVQYNSKSRNGCPVEGIVEKVRDTDLVPLLSAEPPPSRFLVTVQYTDPTTTATKYAQVYCHRLVHI